MTHLTQQQSLILIFLPPEEEFYEFKIILCTQDTIGNWSIAIYMKESPSPHIIREAKNWKIPFFSKNIVTDDACLKMKDWKLWLLTSGKTNMVFFYIILKRVATKRLYIEAGVNGFKNEHAVL